MLNKKIISGTLVTLFAVVCLSACSKDGSETSSESVTTTTVSETTIIAENEIEFLDDLTEPTTETYKDVAEANSDGDGLTEPLTADPESAVKVYLKKLSESEDVVSLEFRDASIGQSTSVADKYYESPLAEQFGIENDTPVIPLSVTFYIEYTEASGLESGEKNEYIVVKCGENGFEAIDTFPYDPKDYYGEVKEILTNDNGDIQFYMVELDGGLGTVKCNNAVWYSGTQKFEIGERIYIYGNGDIYGDPPRIDAVSISRESEAS